MEKKREKSLFSIEITTGSLWKNILLFSLPLMMTQVLEVLFNLSDVAIAGKFADYLALGAGAPPLCWYPCLRDCSLASAAVSTWSWPVDWGWAVMRTWKDHPHLPAHLQRYRYRGVSGLSAAGEAPCCCC